MKFITRHELRGQKYFIYELRVFDYINMFTSCIIRINLFHVAIFESYYSFF